MTPSGSLSGLCTSHMEGVENKILLLTVVDEVMIPTVCFLIVGGAKTKKEYVTDIQ